DPQKAAECLARPLLVDRLIQSNYASDERFHGQLKARAQAELTSGALRNSTGRYSEIEWQRGTAMNPQSGVMTLEPAAFDARVRELRRALGGASGNVPLSRASVLREDSHRFYAVSVLAL